jgi:hypothetical protein
MVSNDGSKFSIYKSSLILLVQWSRLPLQNGWFELRNVHSVVNLIDRPKLKVF